MRWWALRLLKQNDVLPEEVVWRKRIDRLKDELAQSMTEPRVTAIVHAINNLVRQLNTMGTMALSAPVVRVSMEEELARLRERVAARLPATPVIPLSHYAHREPPRPPPPPAAGLSNAATTRARIRTCANPMCGYRNPLAAQYCRRCGSLL
jgi:hypothetical protein